MNKIFLPFFLIILSLGFSTEQVSARFCANDPINNVDVQGLAKVAVQGGELTEIGKAITTVAKDDPAAARSLLLAAQVNAELSGTDMAKLFGDGGESSIEAVKEAIDKVALTAASDGRREWGMISAHAALKGEGHFTGQYQIASANLNALYAPVIAKAQRQHEINRLFESAGNKIDQEFRNSFGFKIHQIGMATADLPMHAGAAVFSGAMATDVTTGSAVTWNGWGNGFGLQEVTPGERAFAASMVFIPIGRGGNLVDDFARVGARGKSFAGTASRPWGAAPLLGLPAPMGVASEGGVIRAFAQQSDQIYYRVFSGNQQGTWLTAIRPKGSEWAQNALALPAENAATFVQEVLVPAGTQLQRSRALPAFGKIGGAEQFKLLEYIPIENFGPGVPLR